VVETLNSEEFRDTSPGEVYATLLDMGRYLCSERTMYRILKRLGQNTVRWQSAPRKYAAPELLATRPNQLWSWDITKLKGPRPWTYYYLYKILDIYSRFVVGWMVSYQEIAALARELIAETCHDQGVQPDQLTVHADNGSPMKSMPIAQLLSDLGVTKTHSRPYVSNDNPYSESAFKTLKYRPDFPERFDSIEQARSFCRGFFQWYNHDHRHSGIAMLTPTIVHLQQHEPVLQQRSEILLKAFAEHPERFVRGIPQVKPLPTEVWINKPTLSADIQVAKQ
jgi:transposase InsO family protein